PRPHNLQIAENTLFSVVHKECCIYYCNLSISFSKRSNPISSPVIITSSIFTTGIWRKYFSNQSSRSWILQILIWNEYIFCNNCNVASASSHNKQSGLV